MTMRADKTAGATSGRRDYFSRNVALYVMLVPGLLCLMLFQYVPMYGAMIAFQKYSPIRGVWGSQWVGLQHFRSFFSSPYFSRLIGNTFSLGILTLLFSFPAPILLALLFNELRAPRFKRVTQTISYMPYFISTVIVVGLMKELTSINDGVINDMITLFGGEKINFFADPRWFRTLYVVSAIWSGVGYNSILYLAAISSINPELYESATLDGADRLRQALHITLPCIAPTIAVLLTLSVGGIVGNDFEKILLMQVPLNYETSDVISTYVYREGILGGSYSYSAAVGLFTSVISLLFLLTTNWVSRTFSENSLF